MNGLMVGMRSAKNTGYRVGSGVAVAALIAVSSYSLGGSQAGLPSENSAAGGEVNVALAGNSSKKNGNESVNADKVNDAKGVPVSTLIKQAKKKDAAGFAKRLEKLKGSPEFSSFLISQAGSVEAGGIEGLAAALTEEQVDAFVASLKGKSFEVVVDSEGKQAVALTSKKRSGNAHSALASNSSLTATTAGWSGPSCWQGWLAGAGYYAATGALCGAVGAMSAGLAGPICAGGLWAFGMGINWNDACR